MSASEVESAAMHDKRVLVTGGTGFLGSHLVRKLVELGAQVVVLGRTSSSLATLDDCADRLEVVRGDLGSRQDIHRAVERTQPHIVFHLGACGVDPRITDPSLLFGTNVLGTLYLLESLIGSRVERVVHTGTCFEYGSQRTRLSERHPLRPLNEYAVSKAAAGHLADLFSRRHGLPAVSLRLFTFFGPHERPDRLIPSTIRAILEGRDIEITSGRQTRDYTYVEDMVEACLRAAGHPRAIGETFNIGSGRDYSVLAIVKRIRRLMGSRAVIRVNAIEGRRDEAWRLCCDPSKAGAVLGWHPRVAFDEGLRRTIQWTSAQRDQGQERRRADAEPRALVGLQAD